MMCRSRVLRSILGLRVFSLPSWTPLLDNITTLSVDVQLSLPGSPLPRPAVVVDGVVIVDMVPWWSVRP